ncbi:MAG: 3-phosphoshikimate 1-carboxyvinyltransferase [Ignavibacteriaceae bacterium]
MLQSFNHIDKVNGELELPGDKSISHRAVMFSSLAEGKSKIFNLSNGEDVFSTRNCFKQMGVSIENKGNFVEVIGKGFKKFSKPLNSLNAGNSGTTARLISGILIAQNFESELSGDESLSKRPMKRIITPLTAMNGKIKASENFTLPLLFYPAEEIIGINYELPVASAQVKSAVLLAGLHSEQITSVSENFPSRDHTEKMLGLTTKITEKGKTTFVSKDDYPAPKTYFVPSDISTASFFIILSLLSEKSSVIIKNVSLNPTRTGILEVLKNMGAEIKTESIKEMNGEIFGDLSINSSGLNNIKIDERIIPNIIDEIPILSVASIFAQGIFEINNVSELRAKETDRINAICHNMKLLGLDVEEREDGFSISGKVKNNPVVFESFGDHRIAMSFGILSLLLKDGGKVNNFECASISNPDFLDQLSKITG